MRIMSWLTALMLPLSVAAAQDYGDAAAGRDFARAVCAECHGVEVGDLISPNPDAPTFRRVAAVPGMTAIAIRVILNNPHRRMPDLILTRDEIRDVAAYILTLKDER